MSLFNVNKVYLLGNVTKNTVLKQTPKGADYCSFTVATNRSVKVQDGYENKPIFHRVVAWGSLAKIASNLLKGDKVFIEGRLETSSYEKAGTIFYTTHIVAQKVISLSNKIKKSEEINIDDLPFK